MLIGKYNKSLIVTYIGVAFAIMGMRFSLLGNLQYAMISLVIAGVCDMFDGKIARMCKRTEEEKNFGIEIDSLADMVGFVVFPVVIGLSLGLNLWYHMLGYILLVLAGITRLGFFNIGATQNHKDVPVKHYSGLPVTTTSIIIPALWLLGQWISHVSFVDLYPLMTYLVAFLFVANIKIPKFSGKAYWIISAIAVVALITIFFV